MVNSLEPAEDLKNKTTDKFLKSNNFADLRIKMGTKKEDPYDKLIPDELSEDHWAELNNHAYRLYCEEQERKR